MADQFYYGQVDYIPKLNEMYSAFVSMTDAYNTYVAAPNNIFADGQFTLTNTADATKKIVFALSGVSTGTTRTLTAPNVSGTIALTNVSQTVSGQNTFTASSNTFGSSTATGTTNLASGATVSGATKTVNIGTGGATGSTTNINIGSSSGGVTNIIFNAIPQVDGIKIGTGTMSSDVNTLDYYQEGTFTPAVVGTTTAGTGTYSTTPTGVYTRVGNVVSFSLYIDMTAHTGSGNMEITGLPFSHGNIGHSTPVNIQASTLTYTGQLAARVVGNTSKIAVLSFSSGGGVNALALDPTCSIWISGTYMV